MCLWVLVLCYCCFMKIICDFNILFVYIYGCVEVIVVCGVFCDLVCCVE